MAQTPHPAVRHALDIAEESFVTASGPGGQNVNKVATAVQLRVNIYALRLPVPVYARLKELAGSRLNTAGEIVITARTQRSQQANRAEAQKRLSDLITEAFHLPQQRAKTRLNRIGKTKRLAEKKRRGAIKSGRGKYRPD